ncbi:MAG: hypothetical protein A2Z04_00995 [Chloroflexi bacterium RBG_16_57_9]|nr:MAG: hypothetical protein A2Z04_00995 [Chloroflexi bacterium RBG_16_57_9]
MYPAPFNTWTTAYDQWAHDLTQNQERMFAWWRLILDPKPPVAAATPADVVYQENKLQLLRYRSQTLSNRPVPILMVPSIINKYYILDLKPGRSLVEYLLGRGFDVWIIDWGIPSDEDRLDTFDKYINGYLARSVQKVLDLTGQEQLSLLGYCIGGTFTAIYAALHDHQIRNLIQLAAPINFHDDGILSAWASKEAFPIDVVVDAFGNMPKWLMQTSFQWLRPTNDLAQAVNLWERLDDPKKTDDFLTLRSWLNDNIDFPGEAYRKYIRDCYQDNLLVQNRMQIDGDTVDLGRITANLLTVSATQDHICPPRSAAVLNDLVSSQDKQVLTLAGGHIGVVAGSGASKGLWVKLGDWLAQRSG